MPLFHYTLEAEWMLIPRTWLQGDTASAVVAAAAHTNVFNWVTQNPLKERAAGQ
jgi:hypothetical protein